MRAEYRQFQRPSGFPSPRLCPTLRPKDRPMHQIQRFSPKHHRLMLYMAQNPFATREELAEYCGHTKQWVTIVTSSDVFKAQLAQLQREMNIEVAVGVATDLRAQMAAAASEGVDRLSRLLVSSNDVKEVRDATSMLLDSLDMGPSKRQPAVQIQNHNTTQVLNGSVPQSVLAKVRASFSQTSSPTPGDQADVLQTSDGEPAGEAGQSLAVRVA